MYLKEISVPIPFDKCRIVIEKEKTVRMELSRTYSRETKDSRVKRKVIGQALPLYPGRMYPNENYFALVPNEVPAEIRDPFLRRCARQRELAEMKKDPEAMMQRVSGGIRALQEAGRALPAGVGPAAGSSGQPEKPPWYIADEHDLEFAMKLFGELYSLLEAYAAKDPNGILAAYKVRMFNRILQELKLTLPEHRIIQRLELLEEPAEEADGMSNSDALMLLAWYKNALK